MKKYDLIGHTFGKLTVVDSAGKSRSGLKWRCVCECGNEKITTGSNLRRGRVRSCGCARKVREKFYRKYSRLEVDQFVTKVATTYERYSQNWIKVNGTVPDKQLLDAAIRFYGTWNKALEANGFAPANKQPLRFSSAEEVKRRYLSDFRRGVKRGDISYRKSIEKYFGSLDDLDRQLGIDRSTKPKLYTKADLNDRVREIRECSGADYISSQYLDHIDKNITYSIREYYGSLTEYFSHLDLDYYKKPYVPFKWDANNIKRQLLRWIREGKPVNYTSIAQNHTGILVAARKLYGGWEQLFTACGLNYDDYRTDSKMASFYGGRFEELIAKLLSELNIEYERAPEINGCRPDFVLRNGVWIDAKLSQWTIHQSDCNTIKKYEPNCDDLIIIFLRGDNSVDKKISNNTRLVSVYKLLSRLQNNRRDFYIRKFDEIERHLDNVS